MTLQWTDSREVAIALIDKYPDINPLKVRFTDLYEWILLLEEFNGDPQHCNERILEAIQACWIEELDWYAHILDPFTLEGMFLSISLWSID